MTIAAGFRFDDGVVLCADTKHTGTMTLYKRKLFPRKYESGAKSVFAIVGNTAFARMAARKCETAIAKLQNPSLAEMESVIEATILDIHTLHVNPHPDRGLEGGPDFWLIIGLWSPVDGLESYYTTQTALVPFDVYHCAGSGEYLGHYIIKPRYQGPHGDLNRAVSVACTALVRIKSYDANCGGNSEFILLANDGWLGSSRQFNISRTEEFSEKFHTWAEHLYTGLADLTLPPEKVEEQFEDFKSIILQIRSKHKKDKDAYDALSDALSKPRPSTSQT